LLDQRRHGLCLLPRSSPVESPENRRAGYDRRAQYMLGARRPSATRKDRPHGIKRESQTRRPGAAAPVARAAARGAAGGSSTSRPPVTMSAPPRASGGVTRSNPQRMENAAAKTDSSR